MQKVISDSPADNDRRCVESVRLWSAAVYEGVECVRV